MECASQISDRQKNETGSHQTPILGLLSFGCLSRPPLEHTTKERATLADTTNQRRRVVVLDTEHVVHQHCTKDIEPDVSPPDAKIAPSLTVVYIELVCKPKKDEENLQMLLAAKY